MLVWMMLALARSFVPLRTVWMSRRGPPRLPRTASDLRARSEPRLPKRKVALLLGYSGKKYWGFQLQNNDDYPTIESEMIKALASSGVVSERNTEKLHKCGWSRSARTDKGVSAARHVVTVKLELAEDEGMDVAVARLNEALPADIRVFDAVRVTKGFEAKKSCDRRRYTYLLPECMLASPAEAFELFQKYGVVEDFAGLRRSIVESKMRGGETHTPSLWRISSDETRRALAEEFAAYRADSATVEALKRILRQYVGTRNYHNFTAKMKADSDAAKRYVLSFDVEGDVVHFGGGGNPRWLRLTVVGQSFMLHQIRKMVAVAAEAARTHRAADDVKAKAIVDGLCRRDDDVPLQLVPGDGLYLGEPIFHTYNQYKSDDAIDRPKLLWDEDHPKFHTIEAFRSDVVERTILKDGSPEALLPFVDHLWQVTVFGFQLSPDDPIPECNLDAADLLRLSRPFDYDANDDGNNGGGEKTRTNEPPEVTMEDDGG